jgi:hypothetical protein
MLDSFEDSKQCLQELASLCEFDLVTGPYITGSLLTHILEDNPTWIPNDIDIVCRNGFQFRNIVNKFKNIGYDREEYEPFTVKLYKKQNRIQFIIHDITAEDRIKWADLTMRSICSDGISYVMSDTTLNDIKNKLMIENNGNFTKPIFPNTLESDLAWQKNNVWKYQKYIDRGYQDINNILYNRIVNETSTN